MQQVLLFIHYRGHPLVPPSEKNTEQTRARGTNADNNDLTEV